MTNDENNKLFKRIGERIQYIRKLNHISIDTLSKRSELSVSRLKELENGNFKECLITDMNSISKGLNVEIDYLFFPKIEESIEQFYLAYKLTTLPEHIQNDLQKSLTRYSSKEMQPIEFWSGLITLLSDGDARLFKALQSKIEEILEQNEP